MELKPSVFNVLPAIVLSIVETTDNNEDIKPVDDEISYAEGKTINVLCLVYVCK